MHNIMYSSVIDVCISPLNFVCYIGYFNGVAVPPAQPRLMTGGVMRSYQVDGMEWIKVSVFPRQLGSHSNCTCILYIHVTVIS